MRRFALPTVSTLYRRSVLTEAIEQLQNLSEDPDIDAPPEYTSSDGGAADVETEIRLIEAFSSPDAQTALHLDICKRYLVYHPNDVPFDDAFTADFTEHICAISDAFRVVAEKLEEIDREDLGEPLAPVWNSHLEVILTVSLL